MWSVVIIIAFALMILTPCVIAFAGSRTRNENEPYAERMMAHETAPAALAAPLGLAGETPDERVESAAEADPEDAVEVAPVPDAVPSPGVAAAVLKALAAAAGKTAGSADKLAGPADKLVGGMQEQAEAAPRRGNWHENSLEDEVVRTEAEALVAQAAAAHATAEALAAQARAAQAKANAALAAAAQASEVAARAQQVAQNRGRGDESLADQSLDSLDGALNFRKAKSPRRAA